MGLMFVEYLMERRLRLEDIFKQSGWGNSPGWTYASMHACTHTRTHIYLSKIVTAMFRFTTSGLNKKEQK